MSDFWLSATNSPFVILAACLIEAITGYPDRLHRYVPHPVVWAGALIGALEEQLNRAQWSDRIRRAMGIFTLILLVSLAGGLGAMLDPLLSGSLWGLSIAACVGSLGMAGRNLYNHVIAIRAEILNGDIGSARKAVGRIVGRDTDELCEKGIAAATTESLAESFNDGVIAPLFWFLLGGLCGLFVYKVVNTADSMIGHREERWRAFGWAAARTDDVMNFIPARLSGGLIVAAAWGRGWKTMLRDAAKHASPNAGWPEAAMAGALGCRLGGPASYDGARTERPVFGKGPEPDLHSLDLALLLYIRACALTLVLVAGLALFCVFVSNISG